MAKLAIAAQLYTVRDLAASDFAGTVRAVAQIGYRNVELAGFGNLKTASEVARVLADQGLSAIGSHAAIDSLEKDANKVMDENDAVGNKNIIVPWMPEERRKNAQGWRDVAAGLTNIAQVLNTRGFKLAYHNHSFEFQKFDGKSGFDLLFDNSDSRLVYSELDTYWVRHGGQDPVATISRLGPRVLLLHLKDMADGPEQRFAEVGAGLLDFKGILAAAEKVGTRYGIVEQDSTYQTPPLTALRTSFENLRKLGAV